MAVLRRLSDGVELPVPSRLLIGRSSACGLRLRAAPASNEHASMAWTGVAWELRDLGSRNGTLLDRERLEPGQPKRVARGAALVFGAPEETWTLVDDAPPGALALDVEAQHAVAARGGLIALPSPEQVLVSVFRNAQGEWVAESADGDVTPVLDQESLKVAGRAFRLFLPLDVEGTPMVEPGPTLATVQFRFAVSKNEELVDIELVHRGRTIRLESREHGYVLLTLARQRQADAELSVGERGWLDRDELLRMLSMDANGLNVAIHRARQQLLAAGVDGAQGIVEVRRGHRRFGTDRFEIHEL